MKFMSPGLLSCSWRVGGIQESDVKIKGTAANSVALSSAIMCMLQNPKASASHCRISTVLSKLTTKSSFGERFYKQASPSSTNL